jgi:hypothetical protein
MAVQIQIRRDEAANWTSEDPTLAQGEFGYETDTGEFKIGDGSTAWTALGYAAIGSEAVQDLVGAMLTGNTETGITVTYQDGDGTIDFEVDIGVADGKVLKVDDAGPPASGEFAQFTAAGIKGLSEAELKAAANLEIGTDVLAQQAIGIADNNLLEVDDASAADDDIARFTSNGIEGIT